MRIVGVPIVNVGTWDEVRVTDYNVSCFSWKTANMWSWGWRFGDR